MEHQFYITVLFVLLDGQCSTEIPVSSTWFVASSSATKQPSISGPRSRWPNLYAKGRVRWVTRYMCQGRYSMLFARVVRPDRAATSLINMRVSIYLSILCFTWLGELFTWLHV